MEEEDESHRDRDVCRSSNGVGCARERVDPADIAPKGEAEDLDTVGYEQVRRRKQIRRTSQLTREANEQCSDENHENTD